LISPGRDIIQWRITNPGRTLAQAKLARLGEMLSRSDDSSSPRRGFAQWQRWSFGIFAQARAARLGETTRKSTLFFTCKLAQDHPTLNITQRQFQTRIKHTIKQFNHSQKQFMRNLD